MPFYRRNDVSDFLEERILRRAQTRCEVMWNIHYVCEAMSQKGKKTIVTGCPLRLNGTADGIEVLKFLLKNIRNKAN